jgi:predicted phage terminase large subunit-like protein
MDTTRNESEPILVVTCPPRHGKSLLVSRYLPAWYLGNWPDRRVILGCHEHNYARSWGRRARDTLAEHGKKYFDVTVSDAQSAASDWETSSGGGMFCVGVGGAWAGRGGNLLLVDDSLKGHDAAFSPTIRERQWEWWHSSAWPRREPGAVAIMVGTRWHPDDLIGRILSGKQPVRHVNLPALAEDNDPLGRQPGDALWPERWPRSVLEVERDSKPAYWWLAQYQQRPTRHDKAEWPESYFADIWASTWPDAFDDSAIWIDPSKGTKRGDYAAIVFVGLARGIFWVDAIVERLPAEKLVERSMAFQREHRADVVGVEDEMAQDLLLPIMRRYCDDNRLIPPPLVAVAQGGVKKEVRICRLGPHLAAGRFKLRRGSSGCKLLLEQLKEFPLGAYDDGPDSLESCVRILGSRSFVGEPEVEAFV